MASSSSNALAWSDVSPVGKTHQKNGHARSVKGRNSVDILISKYEDAALLQYWHKEQSKIKTDTMITACCLALSFVLVQYNGI